MIKTLLSALMGVAALPAMAMAADLPSRVAPPVYVPPPVAFSWTGIYGGLNAGYGFDREGGPLGPTALSVPAATVGTFAVRPAGGLPFLSQSLGRRNGFVGGGQVGYNYQFGASGLVVGAEADFDYNGLTGGNGAGGFGSAVPGGNPRVGPQGRGFGVSPVGTGLATAPGNVAFFNSQQRGPGEFLGTIRGRVGYAFDRVLVYGTGGFAYTDGHNAGVSGGFINGAGVPANFYTGFAARAAGAKVAPTGGVSGGLTGYVVGGGIEYAIATDSVLNVLHSSAVTLRVEGLYYDLGTSGSGGSGVVGVSNTGAAITGSGATSRDDTFVVVRAGINFKFGAPAPAVVARY